MKNCSKKWGNLGFFGEPILQAKMFLSQVYDEIGGLGVVGKATVHLHRIRNVDGQEVPHNEVMAEPLISA